MPALASGNQIDGGFYKGFFRSLLSGKRACKADLQLELGLEVSPDIPLVCFLNRLTHQKMADILLDVLPQLAERDLQFALLGDGDPALETAFASVAGQFPRFALRVGYQEDLAHRLIAGADIALVPSRYEPCGLTALYALRYGTLPVIRPIGGLADSVVDVGEAVIPHKCATGFCFAEASAEGLVAGIERACAWFASRHTWRRMQRTAMEARDFSWNASAHGYLNLYYDLLPAFETKRQLIEGDPDVLDRNR